MNKLLGDIIGPESASLIVVDKQAAYLDPDLLAKRGKTLPQDHTEVLTAIDNFIDIARASKVQVIWTRMTEDSKLSPYPISELIASDSNNVKSISVPGDLSYDYYGRTRPNVGEAEFDKIHYDAFAHTGMGEYLSASGKKTAILVGGYATRCVLATAIGANNNGLQVVVPRDLVINQAHAVSEMPILFRVVTAILGQTVVSSEITNEWQKGRS